MTKKEKQEYLDRLPTIDIEFEEGKSGIFGITVTDDPAIQAHSIYLSALAEEDDILLLEADPNDPYYNSEPKVHHNCKCKIVNGKWIYSQEEGSPCEICKTKQKEWNERKAKRAEGRKKLRSAIAKQSVEIELSDEKIEEGVLLGPILIPEKKIPRKFNDTVVNIKYRAEVIRQYVDDFIKNGRTKSITFNHQGQEVNAFVSEIWIKEDMQYDKSIKYGFDSLPIGTAFVRLQILDEVFIEQYVKKGFNAFSIEASVMFGKITLSDEEMDIILEQEANPYAICRAQFPDDEDKYEECVLAIKEEQIYQEFESKLKLIADKIKNKLK